MATQLIDLVNKASKMSATNNIHIGENSPEQVAYKLMQAIAGSEGLGFSGMHERPSREWIIRTYAACLYVVRDPQRPSAAIALLPEK
jgi:hypothetical protein